MERFEIRIVGVGGQGIRIAGIVLATAAVINGLFATHWPSYGVEARGGPSISDIVISREEIDYPRVLAADVLAALNQEMLSKYLDSLKPNGILILDSSLIIENSKRRNITIKKASLIDTAKGIGEPSMVNMIMLGVLVNSTRIVSVESMIKAIKETTGLNRNLEAFKLGLKL
ncbi:MAG: 2-oxoacid:acceptor oxidoreductase family protein [Candidatus Methanomethylicia archaeon]